MHIARNSYLCNNYIHTTNCPFHCIDDVKPTLALKIGFDEAFCFICRRNSHIRNKVRRFSSKFCSSKKRNPSQQSPLFLQSLGSWDFESLKMLKHIVGKIFYITYELYKKRLLRSLNAFERFKLSHDLLLTITSYNCYEYNTKNTKE